MWNYIIKTCKLHLGRYGTSVEEDQALLDKDDTENGWTGNERTCVIYRHGEKRVYHHWIETS